MGENNRTVGAWSFVGLFMVTLGTLMYEILLTRIFSVTLWYHFAFMAISVAMFGMTVGALIVYLRPNTYTADRARAEMSRSALYFAISVVLSFLTHLCIPFVVQKSIVGVFSIALTYTVISVPFVFSGICVAIALTRFPAQVSRLYAADLAGAGLGCVILIWTLELTDGPTAVMAVATLCGIGAVAFAIDARRRGLGALAVLFVAGMGLFTAWHTSRVNDQSPLLRIRWVRGELDVVPRYEKWNSFSRVRVHGDPDQATSVVGWGLSPTFPRERTVRQLMMEIDSNASTQITHYTGDPAEIEHLKYDITNLAHHVVDDGDVLVIGTGGGRDMLAALAFDQKSAVGVEINQNILSIANDQYGEFSGHLDRHPKLEFVNDEARSWVARTDRAFDIIQVSLIDTYAATTAGAFVLSENSLYTLEGWRVFLDHLKEGGVLTFSRWYFRDRPAESLRMTALATESLLERGVEDPRRHIVLAKVMNQREWFSGPGSVGVATILVSNEPFTEERLDALDSVVDRLQFEMILSPRVAASDAFEAITDPKRYDEFTSSYPLNVTAPTDDSPFFFNMLRIGNFADRALWEQGSKTYNLQAVFVLMALLAIVAVLTVLCIIVPLVMTTKRSALAGATPLFLYFAGIGFGFMLIEISQMQRLTVFLGHPVYSLSVVLFTVLIASAIGSFTIRSGEAYSTGAGSRRLAILLGVLVLFGLLTPLATSEFASATTPLRIAIAVAILFPLGLFMGMAFPLGMRLAASRAEGLMPWLWGINGATSVFASVLAVVIALGAGISMSFWTGFACYVAAFGAHAWARRQAAPGQAAPGQAAPGK